MSSVDFRQLEDNMPFGTLNPFNAKYGNNKSLKKNDEFSFNNIVNEMVNDRYKPNILDSMSEYVGYVIYNNQEDNIGIFSILEKLNNLYTNKPNNINIHIIVRIPELHTIFPVPRDENDLEIIKMYPVFSGLASELPPIGSLVRVKFQNIYNQTNGIYVGPVSSENQALPNSSGMSGTIGSSNGSGISTISVGTGGLGIPAAIDPEYLKVIKEKANDLYRPFGSAAKYAFAENKSLKINERIGKDGKILFKQWPRKMGGKNIPITKIILHESIEDSILNTEASLLNNGTGVHFTIDVLGNVFSYNDPNQALAHENFTNNVAIGIEFLHCCYNYKKGWRQVGYEDDKRPNWRKGHKEIIKDHALTQLYNSISPKLYDKYLQARMSRLVLWGDSEARFSNYSDGAREAQDPDRSYVVPTIEMLESGYTLVRNLCIIHKIPIVFPGVDPNTNLFRWGRVEQCKVMPGINAHHRVQHSDGLFQEHYIICRFNDFPPKEAYDFTIKAAKEGSINKGRYSKLPGH